jgi:hypothetical protein
MESALYSGMLTHRRYKPRRHQFTYSLFMAFLDIDRIPELMRVSPFSSYNRWNWAAFDERDHFGDSSLSLRARLAADARASGVSLPNGPILLLTHLRYLGYSFNPVSFYYCYDRRCELQTILAEVNNTFGESRNYWLSPANELPAKNAMRYSDRKMLHVSPFMPMELDYAFTFTPPGPWLIAHMRTLDGGRSIFDATLKLERREWCAGELHRSLLAHPWMTAKVIGAIHWEALKLYLKKVPVFTHPARIPRSAEVSGSEGH